MNKYIVIYEYDGELWDPRVETAKQIFGRMDMDDCYPIVIKRLWFIRGINLTECRFFGTWHNPKEPLRMEIKAMIPSTPEQFEPLDVGYGTDH